MLKKIYALFAVLSGVAVAVLLFYGHSWLSSIGDPRTALDYYGFYTGLATSVLWISAIVLLVLSHAILWSTRSAWAFWTTFLYFAVLTIIDSFVLSPRAFEFRQTNFAGTESTTLSYLIGAGLLILFGLIVLANQFGSLRIRDWMYPPKTEETEVQPDEESSPED